MRRRGGDVELMSEHEDPLLLPIMKHGSTEVAANQGVTNRLLFDLANRLLVRSLELGLDLR